MTYKTFIPRQICSLLCLATVLALARIVLFGNSSFTYLLWNIFLAVLPFLVSSVLLYAAEHRQLNRFFFIVGMIVWLIVLPNAPYIITDLVHVGYGHTSEIFYDTVLVFSCALAGLVLGLYSLSHMQQIFRMRYGKRIASALLIASMLLASFGVSLGRFLRFNSWDIFMNPRTIIAGIGHILSNPRLYAHVYIVTGTLFLLIFMCYSAWNFTLDTK